MQAGIGENTNVDRHKRQQEEEVGWTPTQALLEHRQNACLSPALPPPIALRFLPAWSLCRCCSFCLNLMFPAHSTLVLLLLILQISAFIPLPQEDQSVPSGCVKTSRDILWETLCLLFTKLTHFTCIHVCVIL